MKKLLFQLPFFAAKLGGSARRLCWDSILNLRRDAQIFFHGCVADFRAERKQLSREQCHNESFGARTRNLSLCDELTQGRSFTEGQNHDAEKHSLQRAALGPSVSCSLLML